MILKYALCKNTFNMKQRFNEDFCSCKTFKIQTFCIAITMESERDYQTFTPLKSDVLHIHNSIHILGVMNISSKPSLQQTFGIVKTGCREKITLSCKNMLASKPSTGK